MRCHKIIKTGWSIQNLYAKNHKLNNNKASAFLKKISKERLVKLSSACRRKAVWSYRKLTHADWCSSKYGVENWGNFEKHWTKAKPKNSISHLIYKADNPLYTHKYFALVFWATELLPVCYSSVPNYRGRLLAGVGLWN